MMDKKRLPAPDWNSSRHIAALLKWEAKVSAMGYWATQVIVDAARITTGLRVLDVACGAGEPALSIAERLRGTGEVVGVDIAPALLGVAEQRAQDRNLTNVRFACADAHDLHFPDRRFDRVTSRFGLVFFANVASALREMHRVLRPGGKAAFLVWGSPRQPYFDATMGTVLTASLNSKFSELGGQIFRFSQLGTLAQELQDVGFRLVKESSLAVPWIWPGTPEEIWEYLQESSVVYAPLLRSIPPHRREEIDNRVRETIRQFYSGTQVEFTAELNLVNATK
jgi:ubiquinone/menaquinone biosynthesis C-methylase UbiE